MEQMNGREELQQKVNFDLQRALDRVEILLAELNRLAIILEERVENNKQRTRDVQAEVDDICKLVDEVRIVGTERFSILEERCDRLRRDISTAETELKSLQRLRTTSAVQEAKLSTQAKVVATIIGIGVSIISTIITLVITHVLGGG